MKAIGIILAGGNNNRMKELTAKRAVPALPVAGSFRAIDFSLSSMSNSHIQTVAILTQYNARSLNEHLSSSKWWNFGRKQGGLFLFTPTVTADNSDWYRGTADAMYQNIDFLKRRHEPYVIISSGDCVYKLDFNRVLDFHIEKKSDITVVCKDMMYNDDVSRFGVVRMDEESRITEFDEKPIEASSNTISTGIYVIRRRQLIELLEAAAGENRFDFVNDILVRYKNVKKIYTTRFGGNKVEALRDVNFSVEPGEYVAIMGESGSGKSTLLNILAQLDCPTSGKVILKGRDLSTIKEKEMSAFRRQNLGFVFQDFHLLDTFTLKDNIFLPLVLSGRRYEEMEQRLAPIARHLGIEKILEKYPYEVSGGQKQRVAVARALIIKPQIVLADEPTGALDSKAAQELLRLFSSVNHDGQTILMVTHSVKAASSANRVMFIKDGEVFHQLYRGNLTDEQMYQKISDTLTVLEAGGERVE